MILFNLEDLVGLGGHTTDEEFQDVLEQLAAMAELIDEEEETGDTSEMIVQVYREKANTEITYELWYQVRTPDSPEGMEFAFGFDRAS